jgi:integrase
MKRHMFSLHHKAPTDPLFQTVTRAHGRLKPTHLDDIVGRIADEIGEEWITPHSLRHYGKRSIMGSDGPKAA